MAPDFIVTNAGTTILIRPVTPAAKGWIEDNVETEPWQWLGDSFGCDHRPGWGLVEALEDPANNFLVEVR